jgi:pimeloyl-ACP methyl ester carboxylesterase
MQGRIVAEVVADVIAIADALSVDQFAVTGGSGGGPHALACAALLPDRVLRCLVAVSIAPYGPDGLERFEWLAGMTEGNVVEFDAALSGEDAMRAVAGRERKTLLERLEAGRSDFLGDSYEMADSDKAQMTKHLASMTDQLRNGLAPGVDGWVDDNIAFTKPWGFEVSSVRVPVYLSYGRDDTLVPAAHGDWLAAHLPDAKVVIDEAGHFGDDATVEGEMAWLAGAP